ncbi:phosphatidate cytidylyltransferase [Planctomyces sp. SH-PL62]|uniref:phosphatidate cytidylyltransferase n=1 Tax=Planctomyces sp. SH-PL62 TaxID=1636152 RepID=UPI00078C0BD3|nr:phosphatidate cytidylyltransferase [Planctomyces sp. SH-PL62]AMV36716.1 Phosphatidate cytidylyltransferase [Planctomyces sp. SH-PL62]
MLRTRVVSGVLIVAALVLLLAVDQALAPWFPLWFLLSAFAMGAAARELIALMEATPSRPYPPVVFGGLLAILAADWVPHVVATCRSAERISGIVHGPDAAVAVLAWPFLSFTAVLMAAFVAESLRFDKPGRAVASIAGTILIVAYVGLLGSFLVQMRWLDGCKHGLVPLAFLIATAKGADVGAYTIGRLAGRHKLWPEISPNKTVEGAIGGLAFALAAALLVEWVATTHVGVTALGWPGAAGFGLVIGVVAQVGDLMESMIKRDCRRKDASAAVPGFGGVLDVLDSLLFAAPVAYGLWACLGP